MNENPFNLNDKIALITGASRGIGEAVARLLARYNAHVIITSRKVEGCEAVSQSIIDEGGSAEPVACHIGDPDVIRQTISAIMEKHGRIDILVNNAATNPYFGSILDTPTDALQKTIDINIQGYFMMSAEVGKAMRSQGGGNIVNVASVNGVTPGPCQGIYSITKAAVIAMTKAFARECAPMNIRVNALLPGLTNTQFASALTGNDAMLKQILPRIPMNRAAQPEEMAGAVLYLVSDTASYTTGACLNVDGGYLTT